MSEKNLIWLGDVLTEKAVPLGIYWLHRQLHFWQRLNILTIEFSMKEKSKEIKYIVMKQKFLSNGSKSKMSIDGYRIMKMEGEFIEQILKLSFLLLFYLRG